LLVGEEQREAEELADEPRQAATGAVEELSGLGGDEIGGRPRGCQTMIEHRVEERGVGLGDERRVDEDALRQRGVLPEAETTSEPRMADEPEREVVATVEVEAAQTVELMEEVVAEALGLVEDDDRDHPVLVDEGDQGSLDVADDLGARARLEAELGGEHSVEIERLDREVAEVDDAVLASRQRAAQVAQRGRLADARFTGDDADPGLSGEPGEGPREALVVGIALEEARTRGAAGQRQRSSGRDGSRGT